MLTVPIITLTTDFGYTDPFVGIMKGVILSINPLSMIVDINHGVSKYNIREAALNIGMSYRQFPPNTIHVVVTDPGVGSERRPILVITETHFFIGPDNGVFSVVFDEAERCHVFHITAEHYFMPDRSSTFHGRDIFAPVAAWLSKGIEPQNFGDEITDYVKFIVPTVSMPAKTAIEGEVIYLDHFGNAITNIRAKDLNTLREAAPDRDLHVITKGREVMLKEYYSHAEDKGLYAVMNSMGYLELFVYKGDASTDFNIKEGDKVTVMLRP
jgi:S-adenosylmethionine hydrolase